MKPFSHLLSRFGAVLFMLGVLSGCATSGTHNPADPLEGFNRAMFKFNDTVDTVALKPAATVYQKVLPSFVQTGVGNFFGNLADAWTAVNNLLQGKVESGLTDVMRVAVNSTFGLAGVLDIGSEAGLPKHKEDFGQTLGKWGVKPGPYVVLPMFGPSTLRDSLAFPLDLTGDPWSYVKPAHTFVIGSVVRVVDQRAAALDASGLVEDAALDRYEFIRDAYLQRRESKVHDGETDKEKAPAAPDGDGADAGNDVPGDRIATRMVAPDANLASRDGVAVGKPAGESVNAADVTNVLENVKVVEVAKSADVGKPVEVKSVVDRVAAIQKEVATPRIEAQSTEAMAK